MMHGAGHDPAKVIQCRVTNVNIVNWTVDVVSQFDRHYYRDIQVLAPYLHYNQGEGIFAVPDVGAVCVVTIPSDTTPPFVSGYLAPMEVVGGTEKPLESPDAAITTTIFGDQTVDQQEITGTDAPNGTRSRGGAVPYPQVDARFDGGRPPAKPGDIFMRGRDGNFVILHRGGVLQIGASELSQRMFIPLGNKILDISGSYEHLNVGGGVQWGIQEGPSINDPPAQRMDTYRVFANDEFCDVRVARGNVWAPVGEPDGDAGDSDDLNTLGIGTKELLVYEVALAKGGFKAGSGDVSSPATRNETLLRFFFDQGGGVFLRAEGAALFHIRKELRVHAKRFEGHFEEDFFVEASTGLVLNGGTMAELRGDVVRIQSGTQPIARMGDSIAVVIPTAQVTGTLDGAPFTGVLTLVTPAYGSIISGNPNALALVRACRLYCILCPTKIRTRHGSPGDDPRQRGTRQIL